MKKKSHTTSLYISSHEPYYIMHNAATSPLLSLLTDIINDTQLVYAASCMPHSHSTAWSVKNLL